MERFGRTTDTGVEDSILSLEHSGSPCTVYSGRTELRSVCSEDDLLLGSTYDSYPTRGVCGSPSSRSGRGVVSVTKSDLTFDRQPVTTDPGVSKDHGCRLL